MRVPGGFWKRPTNRTYAYNLDLGEHYYYPMTSYLETERGFRGESPGALTYSERLARRWLGGRRYSTQDTRERYARSASLGRVGVPLSATSSYLERETSARAAAQRARSEVRENRDATPPFEPERDPWNVSAFGRYKQALMDSSRELRHQSLQRQNELASRRSNFEQRSAAAQSAVDASRSAMMSRRSSSRSREVADSSSKTYSRATTESRRRVDDDVLKKISDLHMMPWSYGPELDEAKSASARARTRIMELEKELDEITKRAISSRSYSTKTASQMAREAMQEDEAAMASSYKKSRKVMIESSNRM